MLEGVLGSVAAERVLVYLVARGGSCYALEVAKAFDVNVSQIQRSLARLEREGVLVSKLVGRTRVYEWNPRFAFRKELEALLTAAINVYPSDMKDLLLMSRQRPRRAGKPL
jgi:predicted ArsR family transcriptional regulator